MKIDRLATLLATIRATPAFSVDAKTRVAYVAGIDTLNDIMATEARTAKPFKLTLAAHGATGGDIQ